MAIACCWRGPHRGTKAEPLALSPYGKTAFRDHTIPRLQPELHLDAITGWFPEAHLAFADYYFEINKLADAEARYRQVLKFPKSSAYQYAKYKMGWIHLNLQRFQEALEAFFEVAQATKNDKKQEILNRAKRWETK